MAESPGAVVECPGCGAPCVGHLHLEPESGGTDPRAWKVLTCAAGCGWFTEELFLGRIDSVPRREPVAARRRVGAATR
jgi:hypothetical protein